MFILTYDFTPMSYQLRELPVEHKVEVYTKFEDLLAQYRYLKNRENPIGICPMTNIKPYKVALDEPLDLDTFL